MFCERVELKINKELTYDDTNEGNLKKKNSKIKKWYVHPLSPSVHPIFTKKETELTNTRGQNKRVVVSNGESQAGPQGVVCRGF